jgi:hypothetical protein
LILPLIGLTAHPDFAELDLVAFEEFFGSLGIIDIFI